jgi:hypothetical protein
VNWATYAADTLDCGVGVFCSGAAARAAEKLHRGDVVGVSGLKWIDKKLRAEGAEQIRSFGPCWESLPCAVCSAVTRRGMNLCKEHRERVAKRENLRTDRSFAVSIGNRYLHTGTSKRLKRSQ